MRVALVALVSFGVAQAEFFSGVASCPCYYPWPTGAYFSLGTKLQDFENGRCYRHTCTAAGFETVETSEETLDTCPPTTVAHTSAESRGAVLGRSNCDPCAFTASDTQRSCETCLARGLQCTFCPSDVSCRGGVSAEEVPSSSVAVNCADPVTQEVHNGGYEQRAPTQESPATNFGQVWAAFYANDDNWCPSSGPCIETTCSAGGASATLFTGTAAPEPTEPSDDAADDAALSGDVVVVVVTGDDGLDESAVRTAVASLCATCRSVVDCDDAPPRRECRVAIDGQAGRAPADTAAALQAQLAASTDDGATPRVVVDDGEPPTSIVSIGAGNAADSAASPSTIVTTIVALLAAAAVRM